MNDLVFGLVVCREGPRQLVACFEHLRRAYPNAPVFCISDGWDHPAYAQVAAAFSVDYIRGERLKLISSGARWWDRFLGLALSYGTPLIVKIDPDTFLHRPFRSFPAFDVFGTIGRIGEPGEHVQGGCQGIRRAAAEKILESGLCCDPIYQDPYTCPVAPGVPYSKVFMSTDFTLVHMLRRLSLSYGDWSEVDSRFIGHMGSVPWKRDAAATHPHKAPPYDVECDWTMLTSCNYRCRYCRFSPAELSKPVEKIAEPEAWARGFDATRKTWLIHIRGGEPFLNPDFPKLAEALAQRHMLSLSSHLDAPGVEEFTKRVPPQRVRYIHVNVHPEQRQRNGTVGQLKEHIKNLVATGFLVYVSVVMTPDVCRGYPWLQEDFARDQINLLPQVLNGEYEGRSFPEQYEQAEIQAIRTGWNRVAAWFDWTMIRLGEHPTINFLVDQHMLAMRRLGFRGRLCESGRRFVALDAQGYAWRCSSGESVGNLLHGTLHLNGKPRPCQSSYCRYFCAKYSVPLQRQHSRAAENPHPEPDRGATSNRSP